MSPIEYMIDDLVEKAEPVKPADYYMRYVAKWMVVAVLSSIAVITLIGPRFDWFERLFTFHFWIELGLGAMISVFGVVIGLPC